MLAFFFWLYFLVTVALSPYCEFAANWLVGWFDRRSPLQLFTLAFLLAFFIWLVRVVSYRREINAIETALQGALIVWCLVSLGFVKAMLLPFAPPSYQQMETVARFLSPQDTRLNEAEDLFSFGEAPPWPYEFPKPPAYPSWISWFDDYNPPLEEIFTSTNSPTYREYKLMLQCAARYRAREREYADAVKAYDAWYKDYSWRVDPKYLRYRWE